MKASLGTTVSSHTIQTLTFVQARRTSPPKGKLVMKMNVQWIWMRSRAELEEKTRFAASF